MKKSLLSLALVALGLLAGCSGGSSKSGGGGGKVLRSISVAPANSTLNLATAPLQFTATGTYSDGSMQTLTQVTWISSAPTIATISSSGLATGVAVGMVTISATSGGVTGSTSLTIAAAVPSLVSIAVGPPNPSVALGQSQQFTATGTYSDGSMQVLTSQVTWSSSMMGVAAISTGGLATSASIGSSTITATLGSISGNTQLTVTAAQLVSIAVTPMNMSVPLGTLQQYTATGTYTDNSTKDITGSVTWASSQTGTATITTSGLLTARGLGSSTISATSGSVTGSTDVTINTANVVSVVLQPANATIANGTNIQYVAIATFNDGSTLNVTFTSGINWTSSVPTVATIGPASGLTASTGVGSTMIGVSFGTFSDSSTLNVSNATIQSISISPANPSIAPGTTQRFVATGAFSDGSTQNISTVSNWQSSDTTVAGVSNAPGSYGLATGVAQGSASISASFTTPSGPSAMGSTMLTVSNATLQSIAVTPTAAVVAPSSNVQYTAIGTFSDGSTQNLTTIATWMSSQTSVATLSSSGLATALGSGSADITATLGSVSSTPVTLTVTSSPVVSIAVSCTTPQIAQGTSESCSAIGTLGDGSTQNLTNLVAWTSSQPSVATVSNSNRGQVSGISAGNTTLTAYLNGIVGTANLAVSNATLTSITVTPGNPSISLGASQAFTAVGNFNDGTTQSLTSFVAWSSSSPAVAIISPAGVATSASTGTTTIGATLSGVTGTATLTVN
jgi:hypothetical protein